MGEGKMKEGREGGGGGEGVMEGGIIGLYVQP